MAIKQANKRQSDDALANNNEVNDDFKRAALFRIDKDGNILTNKAGVFLLNPAAIEDAKSANWAAHNVPGQSDPIFQWTSSGARTVSFEALVTADTSDLTDDMVFNKPAEDLDPLSKALTVVSDIASAFFKITVPIPRTSAQVKASRGNALDISEYLNYYRSLLYPTYDNVVTPNKLQYSPSLLVFYSGSSIAKIRYERRISSQHDLWMLTDLKIKITKQLPNLAPMEALVQFTLTQYNVRSFDRRRFSGQ